MKKKTYFILAVLIISSCGISRVHAQVVGVTLPSVPPTPTLKATPPSQISISWVASTESSGTIEGYYVYRNGQQVATTADTNFVDAGLLPGFYNYAIAAYDANGAVSAKSPTASISLILDTTPPTPPTNVTVSGATTTNYFYATTTLTISWSASTDNVGVAGYYVYRNNLLILSSTSAFTGTSLTDTVNPGTYAYTVVAYDAAQNYSNQSKPVIVTIRVDSNPPTTPIKVSVQQISASGVNVSWATSTDEIGVAGYQIYRNGIQVASVAGPPYADSGLSPATTYAYTVAAYDSAGNVSEQSNPVVSLTIQSTSGPGAPYALSAHLLGTSTVELSWAPSIDGLAIIGYNIYRDGTQVGVATTTNYFDMRVPSDTLMYYAVSATDISGAVSPVSATSSIFVPAISTTASSSVGSVVSVAPETTLSGASPQAMTISPITQFLYFGLRNTQVEALQSILVKGGYLSSTSATGFFGNLTLHALQKFQCDKQIVCTGNAGWGTVGPKTRGILNGLEGSASVSSVATSSLSAEIQLLQAELAAIEKKSSL